MLQMKARTWDDAVRMLRSEDHYLLVLIDLADGTQ